MSSQEAQVLVFIYSFKKYLQSFPTMYIVVQYNAIPICSNLALFAFCKQNWCHFWLTLPEVDYAIIGMYFHLFYKSMVIYSDI